MQIRKFHYFYSTLFSVVKLTEDLGKRGVEGPGSRGQNPQVWSMWKMPLEIDLFSWRVFLYN